MSMRQILVMVLLGFTLLLGSVERVSAVDFLGEFCWSVTLTEGTTGPTPGPTYLYRLGVTQMDGSHYTLQGNRVLTASPSPPPFAVAPGFIHAGAIVSGSAVIITGNATYDGTPDYPGRTVRSIRFQLTLPTLSGAYWDMATSFDTVGRTFTESYSAGPATFTVCP
jgi:hypothetical protein